MVRAHAGVRARKASSAAGSTPARSRRRSAAVSGAPRGPPASLPLTAAPSEMIRGHRTPRFGGAAMRVRGRRGKMVARGALRAPGVPRLLQHYVGRRRADRAPRRGPTPGAPGGRRDAGGGERAGRANVAVERAPRRGGGRPGRAGQQRARGGRERRRLTPTFSRAAVSARGGLRTMAPRAALPPARHTASAATPRWAARRYGLPGRPGRRVRSGRPSGSARPDPSASTSFHAHV
jgi:hypothetical protein